MTQNGFQGYLGGELLQVAGLWPELRGVFGAPSSGIARVTSSVSVAIF